MTALRDEFIDHLMLLVEWDRKRYQQQSARSASSQGADDADETTVTQPETDEDGEPIQRNIAQRAAHFAKREIELQQKKLERETRKAKYMAASGGLKYTALAMATREIS